VALMQKGFLKLSGNRLF